MPYKLILCISLPPATRSSVPIYDYAIANKELAKMGTEQYYPCCGKSICAGCHYSSWKSGNKCPFCNSDRAGKTDEEAVGEMMKRVEVNDAFAIFMLGSNYYHGQLGLQRDQVKAIELYTRAAELGLGKAHNNLALIYDGKGDMKKAKFHYEAAAMAGDEVARNNIGFMEDDSGNIERAVKHWIIAASAGSFGSMHNLLVSFEEGAVSRESINTALAAYNNSCTEMRSETRDAAIRMKLFEI
jgi:TPR repeat protein